VVRQTRRLVAPMAAAANVAHIEIVGKGGLIVLTIWIGSRSSADRLANNL
jgi:hypothetical protein